MYVGYNPAVYRFGQICNRFVTVALVVEVSVCNCDFVVGNEPVYPFEQISVEVLYAVAFNLLCSVLTAAV